MKIKIITILFSLIFSSTVYSQWVKQFSPNHDLRDIEFINRYTGWACGENYIYKTTDGGISWNEQDHPDAFLIQQIFPVNENVVYAAGWWNFMKTTNGGENWSAFFAGGTGQGLPVLEGLYFMNENTGWLVGNVVSMKTTNGGISFVDSMRVEALAQDVYFKDSINGLLSSYSAAFYKTSNGGQNWNRIQVIQNGPLYDFYRISVINDSLVWVGSGPVYKSTDFGSTWDSVGNFPFHNFNDYVYCLKFSSALTGYAGGATRELFKTTDGGYNWVEQQVSNFLPGLYLGMFAYNDSVIWVSGRRIILQTVSGGQVGINGINSYYLNNFELFQNYPNPFNPKTTFYYKLSSTSYLRLQVYDILGTEITTSVNKRHNAGSYKVEFDGSNLPSGIYFYSLFVDNNLIDTKKMLLTK